jgi:hypothetical protein
MTGMASEKQREHIRNYEAQRKAKGWAKVTIWLSPEALEALKPLIAVYGSRDAALSAAVVSATAPPVQDTKAGPVADYEGKQAERRSRERPKTLSATLPAGDPVKAASEPQKRLSDDVPVIGSFERKPMPKGATKPKR